MKALIITSQLVQDHEFIYPLHRFKEEGVEVDVYNQAKDIVKGFFRTKILPQKDDNLFSLKEICYSFNGLLIKFNLIFTIQI